MNEKPALRTDIQMIMTLVEGRRVVVFQDPYDLSRQQLAVDAGALPLLQMLDGRHGIRDIQRELTNRSGGRLVYLSDIESFLESLDRAYLLDSEAFRREMETLCRSFDRAEQRPCAHAGKSYDADPERLARFIEQTEAELPEAETRPREVHALVAPHIDIRVARHTYVSAYRHLRGRRYDLVVILGINHHLQDGLFCLSAKNYLTPFGELRTDRDFVRSLEGRVPQGTLSQSDFGHKIEHSVEFQALFLHHVLGETPIVPVLCGGLHEFLLARKTPFDDGRFTGFVEAVRSRRANGATCSSWRGSIFRTWGSSSATGCLQSRSWPVRRPMTGASSTPCSPPTGGRSSKTPPRRPMPTRSAAFRRWSCWRSS